MIIKIVVSVTEFFWQVAFYHYILTVTCTFE